MEVHEMRENALGKKGILAALLLLLAVFMSLAMGSIVGFAGNRDSGVAVTKCYTSILVEDGDTLWGIASDYMTSEYDGVEAYIREVCELNHLDGDRIRAGEYLVIPYYNVGLRKDGVCN